MSDLQGWGAASPVCAGSALHRVQAPRASVLNDALLTERCSGTRMMLRCPPAETSTEVLQARPAQFFTSHERKKAE